MRKSSINSVYLTFIFLLVLISITFSACTSDNPEIEEEYEKRTTTLSTAAVLPIETEPESYRKYALVSSGSIEVSKSLTTDGPLADVHANGEINARSLSLNISGKITSSNSLDGSVVRSFDYISATEENSYVDIRALKVSEYINTAILDEYYLLSSDGNATHIIKDSNDTRIVEDSVEFVFDNNGWIIKGDVAEIGVPLIVETDLKIETTYLFVSGALMVQGDLNSSGELNINTGTPFDKALIVDKNIEVDKLVTIGRVHGSGTFTSYGEVNILGNAEIDGDVTLYGDAKINYLDNIYKAALYEAQEESNETNSSMMLVHSQLFSNVKGKNSVVLFTFIDGNYLLNENILYELLDSNETEDFNFKSYLYGATIDYGAQLQKFDGLSPYYANKLALKEKFKADGYNNIKISESIDIAPSNLYHTFEDGIGNNLGTYQVHSLSTQFDLNNTVMLTQTQRDEAIYYIEHKDEIESEQELEAKEQEELQKQSILDNNETNATIKEAQLLEIESMENNVSSIDKEAFKLEIIQDRVQEWVGYKELADQSIEVNATEIVVQDDSAERRWKKRFKKRVKKIFKSLRPRCYKKTDKDTISYVSSNTNWSTYKDDSWSKYISLNNNGNSYCAPVSASMILNYHRLRKGKSALYSKTRSTPERYFASTENSYVGQMATWFLTIKSGWAAGTSIVHLYTTVPNAMNLALAVNRTYGFTWSLPTLVDNRAFQHNLVKAYIKKNRPLMYSTYTPGRRYVGKIDGEKVDKHTMPVIGYKREYYRGSCWKRVMPEKKWIYVDSTWAASGSKNRYGQIVTSKYANSRGYLRFDSRSNYFTTGTMTYISVF